MRPHIDIFFFEFSELIICRFFQKPLCIVVLTALLQHLRLDFVARIFLNTKIIFLCQRRGMCHCKEQNFYAFEEKTSDLSLGKVHNFS